MEKEKFYSSMIIGLIIVLGLLFPELPSYGLTQVYQGCDCNFDGKVDCCCWGSCPLDCRETGIVYEVPPDSIPTECDDCQLPEALQDTTSPPETEPPFDPPDTSLPTDGDKPEDTTSPAPENPTLKFGDHTLALTPMLKTGTLDGHPEVSILVRKPGTDKLTTIRDVLVDTGASTTALPLEYAKVLGYDLNSLKKVEVGVVGGTNVAYEGASIEIGIVHMGSVQKGIDGYILGKDEEPLIWEVPVLFLPGKEAFDSMLLGRRGVIGEITLTFEKEDMVKISVKED